MFVFIYLFDATVSVLYEARNEAVSGKDFPFVFEKDVVQKIFHLELPDFIFK